METLEVKAQLPGHRPRTDEVRSAKRGEKVVERFLVGDIDDRHSRAPPKAIAVKQVVVSQGNVEQIARRDAWRVLVIVLGAIGRDADPDSAGSDWTGAAGRRRRRLAQ